MSKRNFPASSSIHFKKAEAKAKNSSFQVLGEKNPYRELLTTEASFLDDIEAAIAGMSSAISQIRDEKELIKLREVQQALLAFSILEEQVFTTLLENENPLAWTTKFIEMQNTYNQMLLLVHKAVFSNEVNKIFTDKVKELGRVPLDINAYVSKPTQRLQKYHVLLYEIIKVLSNNNIGIRLLSLKESYKQAHAQHLSLLTEVNAIYGISSGISSVVEDYLKAVQKNDKNKENILNKLLEECLRKNEATGEYLLTTKIIASVLQDYIKNTVFLKGLQDAIAKKKREIESNLNPDDRDLRVLDAAIKETFRSKLILIAQKEGLEARINALKIEIRALLEKRIPLSVNSDDYKLLNQSLEDRKKEYKELSDQVTTVTTQIEKTEAILTKYQTTFHQRQEQRKEELREKYMLLKLEHKHLTLLQEDLTSTGESLSPHNNDIRHLSK